MMTTITIIMVTLLLKAWWQSSSSSQSQRRRRDVILGGWIGIVKRGCQGKIAGDLWGFLVVLMGRALVDLGG